MENSRWSRSANAARGLRPRPTPRKQFPTPHNPGRPPNIIPAAAHNSPPDNMDNHPIIDWDEAWNTGGKDNRFKGPAWQPVEVPDGCEGLMDWNGKWGPAPVDWEGRPSFDKSDAYMTTWIDDTFEATKNFLQPMPQEHKFKSRDNQQTLAVFTDIVDLDGKSQIRHESTTGAVKTTSMAHIVPRYWKPESLENNLDADSFWEYFRTAPPTALDDQFGLCLNTVKPFWRCYPSGESYYMEEIADPGEFRIDTSDETRSETAAREADQGANHHIEKYIARMSRKGKGKRMQNNQKDRNDFKSHQPHPTLEWGAKPIENPTFNPIQNVTTFESDFPALPITTTWETTPGAPPTPPLSSKPQPAAAIIVAAARALAGPLVTQPNTPQPWISTKPPIDIVIRPATDQDIPQLTWIYNHHILHNVCVPDAEPITRNSMARRLHSIQGASFPFLVAVRARTSTVVGMVYADDFNDPRGLYRYTCELEVYVAPAHAKKGVGTALVQTMLTLLDRTIGKNPPAWVDVAPETEVGSRRAVKGIVIHLPFVRRRKPEWVFKWLAGLGFDTKGVLDEIGFSRDGKGLDLAIFQKLTGEILEGSKVMNVCT